MQLPEIRGMRPADTEPLADAIARSDWGARHAKMAWVATHPECRPFVAEIDGAIVGSGVTTVSGRVAWIGTIWVDPAWRGHGLGTALTQATIGAAEAAGCRTLLLVATDAGRPLYEKIGFEVQTHYRIFEAPGLAGTVPSDPRVRAFRMDDLAEMVALDAAATGEDRAHLLRDFAASGSTRCLIRDDGRLGGFVVRPPWGGGATVAPDPADAMAILAARRASMSLDKRVRAGLLATNEPGIAQLQAAGWTEAWHAPRMIRGVMPPWQPNAIWGQFDHAMG